VRSSFPRAGRSREAQRTFGPWLPAVEENIWELQQRKAAIVRDILGEGGFGRSLTREDLDYLLAGEPDDNRRRLQVLDNARHERTRTTSSATAASRRALPEDSR
jgi:hypothetical protein